MIWPFRKTPTEKTKPLPKPEEVFPACPLFQCRCLEDRCAWWVPLTNHFIEEGTGKPKEKIVGRCAVAWLPFMSIELRQALEKPRASRP